MKKNLYYRTVFRRQNVIKMFILNMFLALSFIFRIPIEVVIRKNFGERYFSMFFAMLIALFLVIFPLGIVPSFGGFDWGFLFKYYFTWYAFSAVYIYSMFQRAKEIKRNPSVFDFARFSLSTGTVHPFFWNIRGKDGSNPRIIEIVYEPLGFLIAGFLLMFMAQPLGYGFVVCSVIYSFGYWGAYVIGDNFVMDKIDEMIMNEEMETAFVDDQGPENARGVKFYSKKPGSKDMRKKLSDTFVEDDKNSDDDDDDAAIAV